MLRESIEAGGESADLDGLTDVSRKHIEGVPQSDVLLGFVDSFINTGGEELTQSREELVSTMNAEAMVDAAAVASNFQRMVRIADSTGIGLGNFETVTEDIRHSLGIESFRHHD